MAREWVVEESVVVAAPPERVYEAVADLKRMGQWSPETFAIWTRGRPARPGTTFVGWNRIGWRLWFTNSRVTAAEPGRVFAFRVTSFRMPAAVWGYRVEGIGGDSTRLTEYWEDLRRDGRSAKIVSALGRIFTGVKAEDRARVNRESMRATLARIKAALES
ncbi:SRPBCC family protein [Actinomadura sp. HBU206391]|uniref:SRPBCC family protein n=1 Tax=Actinomadura sp. HBU206391 TaxID=2731692 RepID=UPI00164EEE42|nr:SRPBCC family protein [Actinomadura sp. HBU206391]MBC6458184.1 SRPBCC family protein [Actinomadura sp. HBU206391]